MGIFNSSRSPLKIKKVTQSSLYDLDPLSKDEDLTLDVLIKVFNRQLLSNHMKCLKECRKKGGAKIPKDKSHRIKASMEIATYFWFVCNVYMSKHKVPKAFGNALYASLAEGLEQFSSYLPPHFKDVHDLLQSRTDTYQDYFKQLGEEKNFQSVMMDYNTMMVVKPLCDIKETSNSIYSMLDGGLFGDMIFTTWYTHVMLEEEKAIDSLFEQRF